MNDIDPPQNQLSAAALYSVDFVRQLIDGKKLVALTGAGISTDSGIPDYRGAGRTPKHPMTFENFVGSHTAQVRYWARSFVGWSRIATAQPNAGHLALAAAEDMGAVAAVITQNVDGLHQLAGSKSVVDLHGRLDRVICLSCGLILSRAQVDTMLQELNPSVVKDLSFEFTPDGDAEIEAADGFQIPKCPNCKGVLKPDVVFFGESVPPERVEKSFVLVEQADVLLVAGTSLAVNSGMRFVRAVAKAGKPVVIVNLGPTKADDLAAAKIEANTSLVLERLFND